VRAAFEDRHGFQPEISTHGLRTGGQLQRAMLGRETGGRNIVAVDAMAPFECNEQGAMLQRSAFESRGFGVAVAVANERLAGAVEKRAKSGVLDARGPRAIVGEVARHPDAGGVGDGKKAPGVVIQDQRGPAAEERRR
jgi:hypothetical protein